MLKSMTGYGVSRFENDLLRVVVEIKTLNSKFLDANVRLPKAFNSREVEIRNELTNKLERGKISLTLEYEYLGEKPPKAVVNKELIKKYYIQLKEAAEFVGVNEPDLFKIALGMPMAVENLSDDGDYDEEWNIIKEVVATAISKCDNFRTQEGAKLQEKLTSYIQEIDKLLEEVKKRDPERLKMVKERIKAHVSENIAEDVIDQNRLEQELIYYVEKLDIAEETVRLKSHLDYYIEILKSSNSSGKKLGFVSQEIGREINTIGSKANDAVLQQLVVKMKEENEKLKEQILNII